MTTTPFWKKIHQTVSGYTQNVTEEIVTEILKLSKNELMEGFLSYKPYTKKGYEEWISSADVSSCMKEFIHDLSQDLNLDTSIAYPVMCNYLMFEYFGKIKEFWQITRIGTTIHLKECIWNFYTAERMFYLKTWRHIFEFVNKKYEFAEQYKDFLEKIKIEQLQNNLIKQFEMVINEATMNEKNSYIENWLCRNIREQTELLSILILAANYHPLNTEQLTQLIKLFIQNNFGSTPPVYDMRKYAKKKDLEELTYVEIGCYFVVLETYWDTDISEFLKSDSAAELDKSLISLHLNPGHTIITLVWLMLKFKLLQSEEDAASIGEMFNRQPFILLHLLLSNYVFKKCTMGEIVFQAAHRMLDELCLMYRDRKVLFELQGMVGSFSELLNLPKLVDVCLQTRNGLDRLMDIAVHTFPYDFFSFSAIAKSLLAQPTQYKQTIHLLNNMPTFLSDMTWSIPREEISVLRQPQPAFYDSNLIVFPPNTTVRSYGIFGKNLIQYKGTYSYFLYLEYLVNSLINIGVSQRKFDEDLIQKVIAGYGVVIQGVTCCVDMDLKVIGLERIINKLNKILVHLDGQLLHFELVKLHFEVLKALMKHRYSVFVHICPEIVWKVVFPKIKPDNIGDDHRNLLLNQYIFEETIFMKLFHEEECREDHGLLLIYIKMLHNMIEVKVKFNFQLAGIVYICNFVFLQHQKWTYNDENQRTQITLACLNIFHSILQKDVGDLGEPEKNIYNLCQHAFLNNIYVVESFLRLFIKEKYHLIFLMERESNWVNGPALDKLKCIRMQLALLLLIMNQKKSHEKCVVDDKLAFIVKPVASYFTNSYSPVIAELSCRFLEKLAEDPHIPLLALLELDHYQVQSLFLERLRDPLEEDNVKIAIIDLINTCILNQNGMTAAFFNLKCFMYWDGTENDVFNGDSVSDFMVDYLQNIKKSHEFFKSPLQLGILRLLYNLWMNHRESLIGNIAKLKDFWPVMAAPFFCDYVQDVEVYTIILRIINLEIGANIENVEEKLIKTMEGFLKDRERIRIWTEFVVTSSKEDAKSTLDLLSAWMEFLILTKKVMAESFGNEIKMDLIHSCLDGMNAPQGGFLNIDFIYLWTQLYFMLMSSWTVDEKHERNVVSKLLKFVRGLNAYYKYLSPKIKEIILCSLNRTITSLQKYFNNNSSILMSFLQHVGAIIDAEHTYFKSEVFRTEDDLEKIEKLTPWLIVIFIGNCVMELEHTEEIGLWFYYRSFLSRVLDSVEPMLKHRATLPFAKLAIDFLINYAKSPLIDDFLKVDLFTFHFTLRAPNITISVAGAILSGIPVDLKEWWFILIAIVKLNQILLNRLGKPIFTTCFTLIAEHTSLIREMISLAKYTLDMTALTLVCETLKLVYAVLRWMPQWCIKATPSYEMVMDGVKTTMNASVLSILGYKKINFYDATDGKNLLVVNCTPTDLLVSVLNKYINFLCEFWRKISCEKLNEIIYWGSVCMKKAKPDLVQFLDMPHILEYITLFVDNDFSVPRFELPITSKLTYGTLLCLADYLCKTLNQLSPEAPSVVEKPRQVSMANLYNVLNVKSLGKIFEHCTANCEKYVSFMVYMQKSDDLPNEKLSSFLHYDMSEFSGSSTSAISQLSYHQVKKALEALMFFLSAEIYYTLRNLTEETYFTYKRELSSEIQFFYEFVRKRTSEQYNAMVATPRSTRPLSQSETDIIRRYVMTKVNDKDFNDLADNNLVLIVSQFLMNVCQLSN